MIKKFLAMYQGKPSTIIFAYDSDCARKQAAYWFGCASTSDRLAVYNPQ